MWVSLRSLLVRIPPPQGVDITEQEAPELFQLLRRMQRKVRGPLIHRVVVTTFTTPSSCTETRATACLAPPTLGLGLPLMLALPQRRLLAVLAHEYVVDQDIMPTTATHPPTVNIRASIAAVDAAVKAIELKYGTEITKNPFSVGFTDLSAVNVTGVWNASLGRIEF